MLTRVQELKTSFRDFFGRGTVEDSLQLLQWVSKAALIDTDRHNSLSDTFSGKSCVDSRCYRPQSQPKASCTIIRNSSRLRHRRLVDLKRYSTQPQIHDSDSDNPSNTHQSTIGRDSSAASHTAKLIHTQSTWK